MMMMLMMMISVGVQVFGDESETSRRRWYYAAGYGAPLLVVVVACLVDPFSYGTPAHCWLRADNWFVLSFAAPAAALLAADLVLLALAARRLRRTQNTTAVMKSKDQSRLTSARHGIRAALLLAAATWATWTLGLLFLNRPTTTTAYLFAVLNAGGALVILIFHCVQNDKVRCRRRRRRRRLAHFFPFLESET